MRALKAIVVTSCFLSFFLVATTGQSLSEKAKKWSQEPATDDPFGFDFGLEEENEVETSDDFFDFGDDTSSDDDFFSSDGSDDFFGDDDFGSSSFGLPPCSDFFEIDRKPGENCDNSTIEEIPEIRYPDPLYERLFAQIWSDFQYKLNQESQLYGIELDPLDVDAKLPEPIDLHQVGAGFSADVKMHGIKMFGLSGINLDQVEVTRSENLTDLHIRLVFGFDQLEVNGTYDLKGFVGWWTLDSKGEQPFSIKMINATIAYEMEMGLIDPDDFSAMRCSPMESIETATDNVLIEKIKIPLRYDDIDFKFENLGSFANTVVNGIGVYFLQVQEEIIVGEIRKAVKKNVNSLIC